MMGLLEVPPHLFWCLPRLSTNYREGSSNKLSKIHNQFVHYRNNMLKNASFSEPCLLCYRILYYIFLNIDCATVLIVSIIGDLRWTGTLGAEIEEAERRSCSAIN